MQKLGPLDQVDPTNVGGREQMMNRMTNHQKALLDIKSVVETKKPPRPHVDAGRQKVPVKYKRQLEYGNVYKTFRAVTANAKPRIDVEEPITVQFKTFWGRQNKAKKTAEREHQLNLRAQKARIEHIGSMVERKKNANDPFAHPTYLLSESSQPKVNGELLKQILKPQKIAQQNDLSRLYPKKKELIEKEGGEMFTQSIRPGSAMSKAPVPVKDKNRVPKTISAEDYEKYKSNIALNRKKNMYGEPEVDFAEEIPKGFGVTDRDYQSVKEQLIQVIIKYRLYQEKDLKILFGRTIVHNQKMRMDKLEQIFDEIQKELDA